MTINRFRYYSPDVVYWKMHREPMDTKGTNVESLNLNWKPFINIKVLYYIIIALNYANLSFITVLISPGFCFWLWIIGVAYLVYIKKFRYIIAFIPAFALWLTCIASPVSGMFRYIHPLYIILPMLYGILMINEIQTNNSVKKVNKNGKKD